MTYIGIGLPPLGEPLDCELDLFRMEKILRIGAKVCGTGLGPSGRDRPAGRLPGGGGLQAELSLHLSEEGEGPTGGRFWGEGNAELERRHDVRETRRSRIRVRPPPSLGSHSQDTALIAGILVPLLLLLLATACCACCCWAARLDPKDR